MPILALIRWARLQALKEEIERLQKEPSHYWKPPYIAMGKDQECKPTA